MLGHKNGLPFYDMFAPVGKVETTFTYKEAQDFIIEQFATFSSELSDFAKNAFKKKMVRCGAKRRQKGWCFLCQPSPN